MPRAHVYQEGRSRDTLNSTHHEDIPLQDHPHQINTSAAPLRPARTDSINAFTIQPTHTQTPPSQSAFLTRIRTNILANKKPLKDCTKLAIAYFLSFLIVLIHPIGHALGPDAYVIPLAQLYFPPVVTVGAMLETVLVGSIGCCIGAVLGILAQLSVVAVNRHYVDEGEDPKNQPGGPMILAIWFWATIFVMTWVRGKFPRVANAFVLAAIQVIYTMTSGSHETTVDTTVVVEVLKALLAGGAVSLFVNLTVWPVTSGEILRSTLDPIIEDMNLLLNLTTRCFLDDTTSSDTILLNEIQSAREKVKASLIRLNKAMWEVRLEVSIGRYPPIALTPVVRTMRSMARCLDAMARCVEIKSAFIRDGVDPMSKRTSIPPSKQDHKSRKTWSLHGNDDDQIFTDPPTQEGELEITHGEFGGDKALLLKFLGTISPSIYILTSTCSSHLLSTAALIASPSHQTPPHGHDSSEITKSILVFDTNHQKDIQDFFSLFPTHKPVREEFFLAFYFVFGVREFARDVGRVAEAVSRLEKRQRVRIWWPGVGWKQWAMSESVFSIGGVMEGGRPQRDPTPSTESESIPSEIPTRKLPLFLQISTSLHNFFQTPETRFALKMSVALTLMSIPGLVGAGWWIDIKAVWALVTFAVANSPTVGGSLLVGFYRVIGTLIGAGFGTLVWMIAPGNPYVMSVFTILFAYPWCWVYLHTTYLRIGVTALFTYGLVLLAAYIILAVPNPSESIYTYAWKRSITIVAGVVIAVLLNISIWPYKARVHLRLTLTKTLHTLSHLFSLQATLFLSSSHSHILLAKTHRTSRTITHTFVHATNLLTLTRTEHLIQYPFPQQKYTKLIDSLRKVHSLMENMVRMCEEGFGNAYEEWIIPVARYRKDLWGTVLVYLSVLEGCLRALNPLPGVLPPIRSVRLRLIKALQGVDVRRGIPVEQDKEGRGYYAYYFAYAQATEEVVEELERVGALVRGVVGRDDVGGLFGSDRRFEGIDVERGRGEISVEDVIECGDVA